MVLLIMQSNYLKIDNKFKYFIFLLVRFFLLPICRILYGARNKWVICERGDDAQDNGYIFFEYLCKEHKEINPVFLIKKNSPDYEKVSKVGRVVCFGSIKHFLMCIGSRVKISSNLYGYAPWIVMEKFFRRNRTKEVHVFLQHGISKNYHESFLAKYNKSLSLLVTGAFPEFEYISKVCGYKNGVVSYTGLPRFDKLVNSKSSKNSILIMPTWRTYLKNKSPEDFVKTSFYKCWISLLTNQKFLKACKDYNFEVNFYLHHEIQCYSSLFTNLGYVNLVKYSDRTVQDLLLNSSILITDYSSVYFDFVYMGKNVIFYQFDENEYYEKHYQKGYFDYRKTNLGDVCTKEEDVLVTLENIFKDNRLSNDRINSINTFFQFRDNNNCNRVFEIIWRQTHEAL